MNFDKEPEIEIWDIHERLDPKKVVVKVTEPINELPTEYQRMVDEEWEIFSAEREKATGKRPHNGAAFYMQNYQYSPSVGIEAIVERRVFSINQAFNRGQGLPNGRKVSVQTGIAGIFTTMLYVLTRDEKDGEWCVLYGYKATHDPKNPRADQFAMTSIAGGIANEQDLTENGTRIDMDIFFRRLISGEAGERLFGAC